MNYWSKLVISLFLVLTITFTEVTKSATAMTVNQPARHITIACVAFCEEHHDTHNDNRKDDDIWAFIAGLFAGIASILYFIDGVSHPSIIKSFSHPSIIK